MRNKRLSYWIVLLVYSFVLFWNYFAGVTSNINTTMLAFSYKYGFISRGLLGTIYQTLDSVLPFDLQTNGCAMIFFEGSFLLFFIIVIAFCMMCLNRVREEDRFACQLLTIIIITLVVPMFSSEYNLGRLDMYCLSCSLICLYLIIVNKFVFLVVPLSAVGVMFHQGHVFMYMGIVLAVLIYCVLDNVDTSEKSLLQGIKKSRESKEYLLICLITFVIVSALFIWFEGFSRLNGAEIAGDIIKNAREVGPNQEYHKDVVSHEILGIDLSEKERAYHLQNAVELPIYLVLICPYILIMVRFFKELVRSQNNRIDKMKYIVIAIGSGTILPDMILKVDFGRWIFAVIIYYLLIIMALYARGDKNIADTANALINKIKLKFPYAFILLIYPLLFQPHMHIAISPVTDRLANLVNDNLNIWVPWN